MTGSNCRPPLRSAAPGSLLAATSRRIGAIERIRTMPRPARSPSAATYFLHESRTGRHRDMPICLVVMDVVIPPGRSDAALPPLREVILVGPVKYRRKTRPDRPPSGGRPGSRSRAIGEVTALVVGHLVDAVLWVAVITTAASSGGSRENATMTMARKRSGRSRHLPPSPSVGFAVPAVTEFAESVVQLVDQDQNEARVPFVGEDVSVIRFEPTISPRVSSQATQLPLPPRWR